MKKNQSKKPQDSLLAAFKSEALEDMGTLKGIKGGVDSKTEFEEETNEAHTSGDTGACDNDTIKRHDFGAIVIPLPS